MHFIPFVEENKRSHQFLNWRQGQSTGLSHVNGFESKSSNKKRKTTPNGVVSFLVDDIGLEPMTFRTSSGYALLDLYVKVHKSTENTYILYFYYTIKLNANQAKSSENATLLTFC